MTERTNSPLLGIFFMIVGIMFVPALDICAKTLSQNYPLIQVIWSRFFFHFLIMLPIVSMKFQWWKKDIWKQKTIYVPGIFLSLATVFFFNAIKYNPIPDSLSIFLIAPFFVALIAPFFLKEQFSWNCFFSVVIGFVGVFIILKPNTIFQSTQSFALLAGICYGSYLMSIRKIADKFPSLLIAFFSSISGIIIFTPIVGFNFIIPDFQGLLLTILLGATAALGHFFMTIACKYAEASTVTPFMYGEIIVAIVYNYVIFQYFPSSITILGMVIISLSGVYITWHERQRYKTYIP